MYPIISPYTFLYPSTVLVFLFVLHSPHSLLLQPCIGETLGHSTDSIWGQQISLTQLLFLLQLPLIHSHLSNSSCSHQTTKKSHLPKQRQIRDSCSSLTWFSLNAANKSALLIQSYAIQPRAYQFRDLWERWKVPLAKQPRTRESTVSLPSFTIRWYRQNKHHTYFTLY